MKDLTCIIPCFGRPLRTIRAIESIIAQNFNGSWEALFIGDGCPDFQKYLDNGVFNNYKSKCSNLFFKNLDKNHGGWGTMARKEGIGIAQGRYICFLDNDDVISPNHFQNYFDFMNSNIDLDFGYFNSYVEPLKSRRNTYLGPCAIGNAEIIVKSHVIKQEYNLDYEYEHDWRFIKKLIQKRYIHAKCRSTPTYIVKSIPSDREKEID